MQELLQSLQDKQTMMEMREVQKSTREAMMRAACWEMAEMAAGRQTDRSVLVNLVREVIKKLDL